MIAKYYQDLTESVLLSIKSNEPCYVIGMCEYGKNLSFRYLSRYLHKNWQNKKEVFLLDLVGDYGMGRITLTNVVTNKCFDLQKSDMRTFLLENYSHKGIVVIINADENDVNNLQVIQSLINLRTLLGLDFTYIVYGYINVFNHIFLKEKLGEVITRRILKVLPLKDNDIDTMIKRQESLFSVRLTQSQKQKVRYFSGGNAGLIKTLVMQISEQKNWQEPDMDDEKLIWRISRLFFGLTEEQLSKFKNFKNFTSTNKDFKVLRDFGYLVFEKGQSKPFTPLCELFLSEKKIDNLNNLLTDSEAKILDKMLINKDKYISREELARLIWGPNFLNHYSDYALDKHISNLRKKLTQNQSEIQIKTLKGRGFLAAKNSGLIQ